jgi:hypothetical protein
MDATTASVSFKRCIENRFRSLGSVEKRYLVTILGIVSP